MGGKGRDVIEKFRSVGRVCVWWMWFLVCRTRGEFRMRVELPVCIEVVCAYLYMSGITWVLLGLLTLPIKTIANK